jgi:streptogramin lyase
MKNNNFLLTVVAGVATIFGAGVAMAQQDVYVSDNNDNTISIIAPGGATTTISSPLLNGPTGLAFNSAGDLFIANNGGPTPSTGDIVEYDPTTQVFSTFATGLANPRGLAFDSNGDLYVSDQGSNSVTEFLGGLDNPVTYATNVETPNGIAIDSFGDLYVALGNGANAIARIAPGGSVTEFDTTGETLNGPNGIVFGPNGNLYVVNHNDPSVEQINLSLVGSTYISSDPSNGLNGAKTLGFDAEGDLYVTDFGNNTVTEYNAAGQLINTFSSTLDGPCFLAISSPGLSVPEPGTYGLLLVGLGALYFFQRRRTTALAKI